MLLKLFFITSLCLVTVRGKIPQQVAEALSPDMIEMILSLRAICARLKGITPEYIDDYKPDIPSTPQSVKCYMECMFNAAKWMTPKGKINFDKIVNDAVPALRSTVLSVVNKCRNIPDIPDNCEKAFILNECFYKADPENYFCL